MRSNLRKVGEFIERGERTTRLETFVDAAFAFALTMLVVSVGDIPRTHAELLLALKAIPAFAASFALIVMFWHAHYRWSRRYGLEDGVSVLLSLFLVFTVLVFLYPLKMMMLGAFAFFTGGYLPSPLKLSSTREVIDLFVWFATAFAAMSLFLVLLFRRAMAVIVDPPLSAVERLFTGLEIQIWLTSVVVGVVSGLIGLLAPGNWSQLAPWVYALMGVLAPLLAARASRRAKAVSRAD
jgi:hypothetical protein